MEKHKVTEHNNLLIYHRDYSPKVIEKLINKFSLDGLSVAIRFESEDLENFDFLKECSFLKVLNLHIISKKKYDLSFLKNLKRIKSLSLLLPFNRDIINLADLNSLESLSLYFNQKITGIQYCNSLKKVIVCNYRIPNLIFLNQLFHIESLTIISSNLKNLDYLGKLTQIKELNIYNCKSLSDIEALEHLNQIEILNFDSIVKINNWDTLKYLTELKELTLNDCKGIESIKFINKLDKLEKLTFLGNTRILDNNLKPALKIPEVLYNKINSYNIEIKNETLNKTKKINRKILKKFKSNLNPAGASKEIE